ncbi:urate hydroxylase PuuD [Alcaligenaceae bacterium]|nr:urate hydroxylase PuuD [Alcaligenaceae bacterium]
MEAFLSEFGNLLLRWLHVIAAIAWIGESIYFVMLDNSLRPPRNPIQSKAGVSGEMWAVHGGGFYHNQKYLVSPPDLPEDLHWSFWKAYSTWLSGFALFAIMYLLKPTFYLVNPSSPWAWAATMSGVQASALAVAFLVAGWVVYDQLCRRISPNMKHDGRLSLAVGIMMVLVSWLSMQMFQGRAAFLLTGAVMATAMSANVFFWIIPGQRRMVKAMKAGVAPNPLDGKRGKQRSVHNTYFTLPVVLLMLSNHYSFTYTSPYAWQIMSLFIFSGALIRQYFVLRHSGKNQLGYPVAGVILLAIAAWLMAPTTTPSSTPVPVVDSGKDTETSVLGIVTARCVQCHSEKPTLGGFAAAPAGVHLESLGDIQRHADQIKQTVASRYMPLGNMTSMTDAERAAIAAWDGS